MTGDDAEGIAEPATEAAEPTYVLRLYVTGSTPRSTRAIENLRQICEAELAGRYDLKVIDIYQNPESAREQQIVAAPTLVRLLPEPIRRVVGDLSDHDKVLAGLELHPRDRSGDWNDAAPTRV